MLCFRFAAVLLLSTVFANVSFAQPASGAKAASVRTYRNPIIEGVVAADPTVIRHEGKYYLYPTGDTRGYDAYVSDDLAHWEKKQRVFSDARGGAWAPDVFHDKRGDGKFYLYWTLAAPRAPDDEARQMIGVAVADNPLGPFVDKGTLANEAIDAHMFQDDDGAYYLYYADRRGGFKIAAQRMETPLKKKGEPQVIIQPTPESWEHTVTEGAWMVKRNGTYYLMYSGGGAQHARYAIGYATAKSPLGPFVKYAGNPIARQGSGVFGPGHHCVAEGPRGGLWMVYHQKFDEPDSYKRFLAIDPLWFDEAGVVHVKVTRGADEPAP